MRGTTFILTVLLGVGILLVVSAFEDVSISDTLKQIVSGQLAAPPAKAVAPPKETGVPTAESPRWRTEKDSLGLDMPEKLEQQLKQEAAQKFPADKQRQDAYVYGTLRHATGWTPIRMKRKKKTGQKE